MELQGINNSVFYELYHESPDAATELKSLASLWLE